VWVCVCVCVRVCVCMRARRVWASVSRVSAPGVPPPPPRRRAGSSKPQHSRADTHARARTRARMHARMHACMQASWTRRLHSAAQRSGAQRTQPTLESLYALAPSNSCPSIMDAPLARPDRSPRSALGGTLPASVLVLPVMEPTMTMLRVVVVCGVASCAWVVQTGAAGVWCQKGGGMVSGGGETGVSGGQGREWCQGGGEYHGVRGKGGCLPGTGPLPRREPSLRPAHNTAHASSQPQRTRRARSSAHAHRGFSLGLFSSSSFSRCASCVASWLWDVGCGEREQQRARAPHDVMLGGCACACARARACVCARWRLASGRARAAPRGARGMQAFAWRHAAQARLRATNTPSVTRTRKWPRWLVPTDSSKPSAV
jgi:hypothetical protein